MNALVQNPDFYWLRQPLLSIERLIAVLADDKGLPDLLREEAVVAAIELASPAVGEQLRAGTPLEPKVAEAALKYVLRMSTRCTPFGLFAGGAVGYPAETSTLDFANRHLTQRQRLDTGVVVDLAHALARQPAISRALRYYANGSVHRVGQRLRYTECQWIDGQWQYFTSELPAEPPILTVLALARFGVTVPSLMGAVATGENQVGAHDFIKRLIEDGLLVSELLPAPTGPDPLGVLIQTLGALSAPATVLLPLESIALRLASGTDVHQSSSAIRGTLTDQLGLTLPACPILQVDTVISGGSNQLSRSILHQLGHTLTKLHALSWHSPPNPALTTFRQRFYARYADQEIPLLRALDEEEGVGYGETVGPGSPAQELIGDLLTHSLKSPVATFQEDKRHELMLRLYSSWSPSSGAPVVVTDEDLASLGDPSGPVPPSYYVFGYFLARSAGAIDKGHFQFVLKALTGPSAFTLMGRFCSSDETLERLVKTHLDRLQASDPYRLYAEIAHLPQARAGNVVQRPHLRSYEIPYLTQSTLPDEQQLRPEDLLVSVPDGQRVVLRSKRWGKEVMPQLTTAHDYRSGLPLYRFLCDLQHQEAPFSVGWHWGALAQARRLPRVQYRNIILQEASWIFTSANLVPTLSDDENVVRLQKQEQLPRLIALQQGDQELFLDLATSICRQLFLSTLRRVGPVRVVEWLRTPENCPLQGPDGKSTHEVVIPFTHLTQAPAPAVLPRPVEANLPIVSKSQRSFGPGSEWLYLKVYCGPSIVGTLLNQVVQLAAQASNDGWVTHWFFVRYRDPDHHLRVRFRLADATQSAIVLVAFQRALSDFVSSGEVYQIQVDTYVRELERYGDLTIDQTERIFWRDSQLVSQLQQLDLAESSRLTAALLGIDAYQTAFSLTPAEKLRLCQQVYGELFHEHGALPRLRQTLAQKYRLNQGLVMRLLRQEILADEFSTYQAIRHYHESIRPYVADVRRAHLPSNEAKRWHYISSLSHMFINRLFGADQRTYELLVYHHLYRTHQSLAARQIGWRN